MDNEFAFSKQNGITKLDFFASQAMKAMISAIMQINNDTETIYEKIAPDSYKYASFMLKESQNWTGGQNETQEKEYSWTANREPVEKSEKS